MAQNLRQATIISPSTLAPFTGDNVLTAVYTGWVSGTFACPGVEHGCEEINVLLDFNFDGATEIEILPEHATVDDPTTWYPAMKLNSSDEAMPSTVKLLPANMLTDPGQLDLPFLVSGFSWFRLRAKATGAGASTTLQAKITAGGGWRGT